MFWSSSLSWVLHLQQVNLMLLLSLKKSSKQLPGTDKNPWLQGEWEEWNYFDIWKGKIKTKLPILGGDNSINCIFLKWPKIFFPVLINYYKLLKLPEVSWASNNRKVRLYIHFHASSNRAKQRIMSVFLFLQWGTTPHVNTDCFVASNE